MKSIWKFPLGEDDEKTIYMPKDAGILCVQEQSRRGVIWALVDPMNDLVERHFKSFITGQEFETDNMIYLGTYQVDSGFYVIHVFEEVK